MLSGLFAESRALGKSASLPRAWWSALGKPIFFFENHLGRKSFFLQFFADSRSRQRSSLPTVALGKEAVTPLPVAWPF